MESAYRPLSTVIDATDFRPETTEAYPLESTPNSHDLSGHGFAQKFGLHPGTALLTVVLDAMLFGGQIGTLEAIYPIVIASAFGLGIVTFVAQKKWYGDDNESAFLKAFIVAGLTAIPTSLPGFLTIPAGIVGLFQRKER